MFIHRLGSQYSAGRSLLCLHPQIRLHETHTVVQAFLVLSPTHFLHEWDTGTIWIPPFDMIWPTPNLHPHISSLWARTGIRLYLHLPQLSIIMAQYHVIDHWRLVLSTYLFSPLVWRIRLDAGSGLLTSESGLGRKLEEFISERDFMWPQADWIFTEYGYYVYGLLLLNK